MATRKVKPRLEGDIEKAFIKKAKSLGCKTRKLNGMGHASWPDRLVLCKGGAIVFIEFKRPGEELRPAQEELHEEVRELGHHNWYTCTHEDDAMEIVKNAMRNHASK